MAVSDAELEQHQEFLELVTTTKRIATPFEEAYQWLKETQTRLDPRETVCTIAVASRGKNRVNHLTWSDLNELHSAYRRLGNIEMRLNSSDIGSVESVRATDNEQA